MISPTIKIQQEIDVLKDAIFSIHSEIHHLFTFTDVQAVILFRLLPKDMSVEVFSNLDNDTQEAIIRAITDKEIANIVEELFFDDMIDIIEEMPATIVKKILEFFETYGLKAYGMTSFGPTVVGIVESDEEANKLLKEVQIRLNSIGGHIYICKPNNTGAKIEYLDEE